MDQTWDSRSLDDNPECTCTCTSNLMLPDPVNPSRSLVSNYIPYSVVKLIRATQELYVNFFGNTYYIDVNSLLVIF